jgi:ABC-type multidrug transport system fused ATPase/permease subunit
VNLFRFIPGYETSVYEAGREPIFVALLAFLICFVITRGYTRVARVRGWGSASAHGVHLHHIVVGIVLALTSGALIIGVEPIDNIFDLLLCAVFGSGAALILDEFALVFRLQDVYWSEEGRASIDAVIVAVTVGVLVLLHIVPFDATTSEDGGRWTLMTIVAIHIALVVVAMFKGKVWLGLLGIFVAFVAFVCAVRLAKPRSPWARRFYPPGSKKMRRAEERQQRHDERWGAKTKRLLDLIGGAPSAPETD